MSSFLAAPTGFFEHSEIGSHNDIINTTVNRKTTALSNFAITKKKPQKDTEIQAPEIDLLYAEFSRCVLLESEVGIQSFDSRLTAVVSYVWL